MTSCADPITVDAMTPINLPFNLEAWIEEHRDDFEPPVSNKVVWHDSDFIFMVIRGPNARNDFHIDPLDEIFMQLEGDIRVDIVDSEGQHRQRRVGAGDVMLIPANTPHSPHRPEGSWGLVIERPRADDEFDSLRWYCDCCGHVLHEVTFHVRDIETELAAALEAFNDRIDLRTCEVCGCVLDVADEFSWPAD